MTHTPPTAQPGSETEYILRRLSEFERRLSILSQTKSSVITPGLSYEGLGFQFGHFTTVATAGVTSTVITLPTAWTKEHLMFIATVRPSAENNVFVAGNGPFSETETASLIKGYVALSSGKTQNAEVWWISIGR